jgi:hypothetical protein
MNISVYFVIYFQICLLSWMVNVGLTTVIPEHRSLEEAGLETADQKRVYFLKKVNGAGCPYTASWLIHIDHYRRITWYLDITKMEAATFNVYDKAKLKFQISDPDAYYVHHMSMFEHLHHKKYGFEVAKNVTLMMSKAAFRGECGNLTSDGMTNETNYIALIPFYGGLPPNVTKDLSVKSIGQGNSLVDASTKGLQTMATVCSCLKYFGKVVIGVARYEDRNIIHDLVRRIFNLFAFVFIFQLIFLSFSFRFLRFLSLSMTELTSFSLRCINLPTYHSIY